MSERLTLRALLRRVEDLEAEKRVRACINRYMALCDDLGEGFDLDPLMDLFTGDAVWEGKGARYGKTFGRMEGREAIRAMFAKYTVPPAHFRLNVHFLTGEEIAVDGAEAGGRWVMLQTSTFASGVSQLSSARLDVGFRREDEVWRIARFQTERLFSRPVAKPWDEAADLPVPE
ncbi:MAG TPA: nuclear transport factor 2 family protein [Azospirillum sp.]